MRPYRPLQRDLPHLHQSGAIKFLVVLGMARAERAFRRKADATESRRGSCLIHRIDRVRADMAPVRQRVGEMRAFWSVDNLPTIQMDRRRVEYFGHVWFEPAPVARADAALTAAATEHGQRLVVLPEIADRKAA